MKIMKKRFLSLFMAALVAMMALSVTASAADDEISDTEVVDETDDADIITEEPPINVAVKVIEEALNADGKLEVRAVPPTSVSEALCIGDVIALISDLPGGTISNYCVEEGSWSEDFSSAKIINKETGEGLRVDIVYKYDGDVKAVTDKIVSKLPKDLSCVYQEDMELLNFWMDSYVAGYTGNIEKAKSIRNYNYISELQSSYPIDYDWKFEWRAGLQYFWEFYGGGYAVMTVDGTAYHMIDDFGIMQRSIIYLPSDVGDTPEELAAAAQKKIDEYVNQDVVKMQIEYLGDRDEYSERAYDHILDVRDSWIEEYKQELAEAIEQNDEEEISSCEGWIRFFESQKADFIKAYNDPESDYYFLHNAEGGYWFRVTVFDEKNPEKKDVLRGDFIVIKDSERAKVPDYQTSDLVNDVSVSTANPSVPRDTVVEVNKLTSGEAYEKILRLLDVKETESVTFDIKLYSDTLEDYITKLESGTFQVKIPIPDMMKDQKLSAYYVDENDKVTEYPAAQEDGYAVFETDHFSIYTIAPASEQAANPPTGDGVNPAVWILLSAVCAGTLGAVVRKRAGSR